MEEEEGEEEDEEEEEEEEEKLTFLSHPDLLNLFVILSRVSGRIVTRLNAGGIVTGKCSYIRVF